MDHYHQLPRLYVLYQDEAREPLPEHMQFSVYIDDGSAKHGLTSKEVMLELGRLKCSSDGFIKVANDMVDRVACSLLHKGVHGNRSVVVSRFASGKFFPPECDMKQYVVAVSPSDVLEREPYAYRLGEDRWLLDSQRAVRRIQKDHHVLGFSAKLEHAMEADGVYWFDVHVVVKERRMAFAFEIPKDAVEYRILPALTTEIAYARQ